MVATAATAMLDADDTMRAIHYAPVPLIVLAADRTIRLLNRPAEKLLMADRTTCIGQQMDRYIATASYNSYMSLLNKASQLCATARLEDLPMPCSSKVQLQDASHSLSHWCDLEISAWHAAAPSPASPTPSSSLPLEGGLNGGRGLSAPDSGVSLHQATSIRVAHEALFTLCLTISKEDKHSVATPRGNKDMLAYLQECAYEQMDVGIMVMTKDGQTMARNNAMANLLSSKASGSATSASTAHSIENSNNTDKEEATLSSLDGAFQLWDEHFEHPVEVTDWPLYQCAVLGNPQQATAYGVELKGTGERMVVELTSWLLHEHATSSHGSHVGGAVSCRDLTAQRERRKAEVETQGDLHFRQIVDTMPQLMWMAAPTGFFEWYSRSFYEYTAATEENLGSGWRGLFHPDDAAEVSKRWSQALREGSDVFEMAYRLKRHDGVCRWFLARAAPMKDHQTGQIIRWFGTCTDIHDQVEALYASKRSQSLLQSVIDHADVTLWAVDRDGKITVAEGPGLGPLGIVSQPEEVDEDEDETSNEPDVEKSRAATTLGGSKKGRGRRKDQSSANEILGRSIYDIWDGMTDIRKHIDMALRGDVVVGEMQIDGRWFRTSYAPLRAQETDVHTINAFTINAEPALRSSIKPHQSTTMEGQIIGVAGASMDITDRKVIQENLELSLHAQSTAIAAEEAAIQASRLKSEFLANMSHEIRTPLAGIIGLTELILDEDELSAKQREYGETIQRSAEGLLAVINDVLDFSKVEVGKLEIEDQPFSLLVLLQDMRKLTAVAIRKKELQFVDTLDINYEGNLLGDFGRLIQVMTNLLSNAVKFTSQGRVTMNIKEMSQDAETVVVRFDVLDTGCGISADGLSRLFQPFSQADASTARRFGGTGLGLSISKNLVELMDGKITLESVEGQGSHASFEIPFRKTQRKDKNEEGTSSKKSSVRRSSPSGICKQAAATTIAAAKVEENKDVDMSQGDFHEIVSHKENAMITASSTDSTKEGSSPTDAALILIAEDNPINAKIASSNVQRMGFNYVLAENGLSAVEKVNSHKIDLVLMDCQMPECDGYEATRMIRRSSNADIRCLPVIALTASAIKGDQERAFEAGMIDYLVKPVKKKELEATIHKWLYDLKARADLLDKFYDQPPSMALKREREASST